jgi:hypothetical protein
MKPNKPHNSLLDVIGFVVIICAMVLILVFAGCASTERYQAQCWQASLAAAIIMQSYGYQTEITIQNTDKPNVQHAQVRAFDRETGNWRWVVIDGPWPTVTWGDREAGPVAKVIYEEELVGVARSKIKREGGPKPLIP